MPEPLALLVGLAMHVTLLHARGYALNLHVLPNTTHVHICLEPQPFASQVRAVTVDKAELKDAYQCPVYITEARFREEVFTAQLKSKHPWIKWTLAGVCLFLDVV